jgi:hypothetical protein
MDKNVFPDLGDGYTYMTIGGSNKNWNGVLEIDPEAARESVPIGTAVQGEELDASQFPETTSREAGAIL